MKNLFIIAAIIGGVFFFTNQSSDDTPPYHDANSIRGVYDEHYSEEDYSYPFIDDPVTSDTWDCTDDCGGHEAGYAWAEENGIMDPFECDGNSESFIEGCEAYANEMIEEEYLEESEYYYEEDYYSYWDY